MAGLKNLNSLERLVLWKQGGSFSVTGEGFRHLVGLPKLAWVDLHHGEVSDIGLAHIVAIRSIEGLSLRYNKITDEGLRQFSKLEKLRSLSLVGNPVSGRGFKGVVLPNSLESLDLGYCPVTDESVRNLTELTVTELTLSGTKITDGGMVSLAKMKSLQTIRIIGRVVLNDPSLDALATLPDLKHVWLTAGPKLTREGVARFQHVKPKVLLGLFDDKGNELSLESFGKK